jgi:hypothetical protein
MKRRAIFVVIPTMVVLLLPLFYYFSKNLTEEKIIVDSLVLTIPTSIQNFHADLKTEDIDKIEEYTLLNALHSPLVLFDNNGQLEANLATRFYWKDDVTLAFHFDRDQRTVDGFKFDAEDALYSIKRMILLDKNQHGRISDRIEIPDSFKHIDQVLENIYTENGILFVRTKRKDPFILHILASADYGIIRRESIDPNSLNINDLRNTSGPYYLSHEDSSVAVLKANPSHFKLSKKNASEIRCLKFGTSADKYIDAFKSGKIDHIPTDSPLTKAMYVELGESTKANIHEARDILIAYAAFSHKARNRFTPVERFVISEAIQKVIHKNSKDISRIAIPAVQFFPEEAVGGIPRENLDSEKSRMRAEADRLNVRAENISITIEAFPSMISRVSHMFDGVFKKVDFVPNLPRLDLSATTADLVMTSVDVGLKEDFTGISFIVSKGLFPLDENSGRKWLEKMSFELNVQARMTMIEEMHVKAIVKDPSVIPMYRLPVFALAQHGWKMDLPKLWVTQRYWQIYKDI